MVNEELFMNGLLEGMIELLDIPESYYGLAVERARSLEAWLRRDASSIAQFDPDVFPQGSFRYGTVIRPLLASDFYDLDLVCAMQLTKDSVTQKKVKELLGKEIKAYAEAKQFNEPAEEKHRCWRLNYADGVSFHMDILPSVPEDRRTIMAIIEHSVPGALAEHAIAITDRRHPSYQLIDPRWFSSNPRGIAHWFEERAWKAARRRIAKLVENRVYASVEEVPPYEWKTPLQRSIQILKRHRDVMFRDDRDLAPISMIITTLAAHSYGGETELYPALTGILERMPNFIRSNRPRVPNPVNPAEDFADRWSGDQRYEDNFWLWHEQVKADLSQLLGFIDESRLLREVRRRFQLDLTEKHIQSIHGGITPSAPLILKAAPVVSIPTAPQPWGRHG
jgi:hypothetical protein